MAIISPYPAGGKAPGELLDRNSYRLITGNAGNVTVTDVPPIRRAKGLAGERK
jgi:hypothetical protein